MHMEEVAGGWYLWRWLIGRLIFSWRPEKPNSKFVYGRNQIDVPPQGACPYGNDLLLNHDTVVSSPFITCITTKELIRRRPVVFSSATSNGCRATSRIKMFCWKIWCRLAVLRYCISWKWLWSNSGHHQSQGGSKIVKWLPKTRGFIHGW